VMGNRDFVFWPQKELNGGLGTTEISKKRGNNNCSKPFIFQHTFYVWCYAGQHRLYLCVEVSLARYDFTTSQSESIVCTTSMNPHELVYQTIDNWTRIARIWDSNPLQRSSTPQNAITRVNAASKFQALAT
jgi:hypothetical protein